MGKKYNLKQKIFKIGTNIKFICNVKKIICLCTLIFLMMNIINYQLLVYAASIKSSTKYLKTEVEYNEDYSKANIKFYVNSIDKEKYEIISITSNNDGKVIYNKNKASEKINEFTYETICNGNYSFTVKYIEKELQTISQNIKKVESYTLRNNEEVGKQQFDKNKKTSLSENSIFKEEKIVVNVSKIKKVETNDKFDNKINLEDQFKISGFVAKNEDSEHITDENYLKNFINIKGNSVSLGKNSDYKNQTLFLNSKFKLNFNRSIIIKGKLKYSKGIYGLTISFNNDKNYIPRNSAGSLGVYKDDRSIWAHDKGLVRSTILEVDNYNDGNEIFGDCGRKSSELKHIAFASTDTLGTIMRNQLYHTGIDDLSNKLINFTIDWDSTKHILKFNVGGYEVKGFIYNLFDVKHIGLSTTIFDGNSTVNWEFDDIKYKDFDPNLKLETFIYDKGVSPEGYEPNSMYNTSAILKDRDLNKYLGTGQTLNIKFSVSNKKKDYMFTILDKLYLENLQIGNYNLDLVPGSIAFQVDNGEIIPKPELVLNKNSPIDIRIPEYGKQLSVYMKVKLPENLRLNINDYNPKALPYLKLKISTGIFGLDSCGKSKNLTVATAPITEGYNWEFDVNNSPAKSLVDGINFDKEKLARVQLYDETVSGEKRSLNVAMKEGLVNLKQSQHYYFDDDKNEFIPITSKEFAYSSKTAKGETGVYAYEFDVSDKRRSKLIDAPELISNKSVGRYTLNAKGKGYGKNSFILTNANEITISDTEIASKVNTEGLKKYLIKKLSIKGYEDKGGINLKKANIDIDFNNLDITNPKPGDYTITIKAFNVDGSAYSNKNINLKVEDSGASGYIVIPKYINMKSGFGLDKDKLVAEEEIFFAKHTSAINVSYGISVDKQFNLIKTNDLSNKIIVTSSSNNGHDEYDNKWYIGAISNKNIRGKGVNVKFTASREQVDKSKGKWSGYVKFYFSRIS